MSFTDIEYCIIFSRTKMNSQKFLRLPLILICLTAIGCQNMPAIPTAQKDIPTAANTPKTLTICLGYEPESLYLYSAKTQAAWGVLEAIYDGPIDIRNYQPDPVILTTLPSFNNSDARLIPVSVNGGDEVVDIHGNPIILKEGEEVFPHGCTEMACGIHWDGKSSLEMDQIKAIFRLKSGIRWSDGQKVSAEDSVFSFKIASDPDTPNDKRTVQQTSSYTNKDGLTVEWTGKPGLLTQSLENYFWIPLPRHALGKYSARELRTLQAANKKPIGWGPYILDDWQPGQFISFKKNPYYFRANEGLPKFDRLVYKFINKQGDTNLMAVRKAECDFSNQTTLMLDQADRLELFLRYYRIPENKAFFGLGPDIEYLIFNTRVSGSKSTSIMADLRLRQAVSYCTDLAGIMKSQFVKLFNAPISFLTENNPFYQKGLRSYEVENGVEQGMAILNELGWKAKDRNANTFRMAENITGIENGTPLTIRYLADETSWRKTFSDLIIASLKKCGFEVKESILSTRDFLSAEGQFWKGDFDLAEFAWASGRISPCFLFSSAAQKYLDKPFGSPDLNVGGYANPEFDQLCMTSLQSLVDDRTQAEIQSKLQTIFNQDLPALPIFTYFTADFARPDFCVYANDISARSDLRDIELMDFGNQCPPKPNR